MFAVLAVAIIGIVAAGCGSSSSSTSSSGTATGSESESSSGSETGGSEESGSSEESGEESSSGEAKFTAQSPGGVVSSLPKEVQPAYDGFDAGVEKSPWVDFKPKHGAPWTVGYASGYAGNSWRAAT